MHLSDVLKFIRGARGYYVPLFFLVVTKKRSSDGKKLFGRKNFSGIFSSALPKIRKPVRLWWLFPKRQCLSISSANHIHMSKFKPRTLEKNSSTLGPPAETLTEPLRCWYTALTTGLWRYLQLFERLPDIFCVD